MENKLSKIQSIPEAAFGVRGLSGKTEPDTTDYRWGDGTAVDMNPTGADGNIITDQNVADLGPESINQLTRLYSSLLESSEKLATQELSAGIQQRIFTVAHRLTVAPDWIDIHISDETPPAPYSDQFAKTLGIQQRLHSVGYFRKKTYSGNGVLISGGVNNFIVIKELGSYVLKILTITRNVISNDGKTGLADAGKAQSPGGGRLENAAALPQLAIDETAEEAHVSPSLDLAKALINLDDLNPTKIQVFVGSDKSPTATIDGCPYLDIANNTLEAYINAVHFIGHVELAKDQHDKDRALLSNGKYIYRASEAALLDFNSLRDLAKKKPLDITPDEDGVIDEEILQQLEIGTDYSIDEDGDYALLQPIGLTPQLANIVNNEPLMQWFADFEKQINTPEGVLWADKMVKEYSQAKN